MVETQEYRAPFSEGMREEGRNIVLEERGKPQLGFLRRKRLRKRRKNIEYRKEGEGRKGTPRQLPVKKLLPATERTKRRFLPAGQGPKTRSLIGGTRANARTKKKKENSLHKAA